MAHDASNGMTVKEVEAYAGVALSDLTPTDRKNITRRDLKKIETNLVEGLEKVPSFNDEWGKLGLATVVCSKVTWNNNEDAALALQEIIDIEEWDEKRIEAQEDGESFDEDRPTRGARKPYPKPPRNPGQFRPTVGAKVEETNVKLYTYMSDKATYITYRSADAYASALIKNAQVLGTEIFANMPRQGKNATARELLDHVRKRFNEMTPNEIIDIKQKFWSPPTGNFSVTEYFARQQGYMEELSESALPISEQEMIVAGEGHLNLLPFHQKNILKWSKSVNKYKTKTFNEFMVWMSKRDDEIRNNKTTLETHGIVKSEDTRVKELKAMNARVETVVAQNDELRAALEATTEHIREARTLPGTIVANQAITQADLQKWATSIHSDVASRISAITPTDSSKGGSNHKENSGAKYQDFTGRYYNSFCANCGVQLSPGKCDNGCRRIKAGHQNIPFDTEEERKKVTIDNYKEYLPRVKTRNIEKYGKEWSTTLTPEYLRMIRSNS